MTTPPPSTDSTSAVPAALTDRADLAWRRPDAFTAWCTDYLPPVDPVKLAVATARMFGDRTTWTIRYSWARARWARSHGYTRHLMPDERRLRAAGTAPPTGAERTAARRGVDVPVDAALAEAIRPEQTRP